MGAGHSQPLADEPNENSGSIVSESSENRRKKQLDQRMKALALLVADGDEPAFECLHLAVDPAIRALFGKRLGARAHATVLDELSQQTWLQAWKLLSAGRYDPERAPLKTFLFGIGLNVWLRHQRASGIEFGRRAKHEKIQQEIDRQRHHHEPTMELFDFCFTLQALNECMTSARNASRFGPIERAILEGLRQGTTERQLALQLSMAPSSVHGRKKSMLQRLRRCLLRKGIE